MCLFTKSKYPLIAEEDIVCYKTVRFDWDRGSGHFMTPFQHTPIPDDVITGKCAFKASRTKSEVLLEKGYGHFSCSGLVVDYGYIHTWKDEKTARKVHTGPIFKCIIPKGTIYYDGYFNGWIGYESMCAEEIKFVERIN